ncbi:UDP-GlcNAc:undecaprenyl-phosphate GlcNAc-1-phosphate transferase [Thermosyntropha lipolytica DSM 11003]|uniref:UDP-GlcNAc:undecaprenyl-phosphate GlcNAc-1-phosphate transferase n=1 Tax=Thermosyntropha lipolytica DSM 11003 TaxID=1123382 RepID=A0A1M5JW40_9FIRM|nr:MraY family glycosyltransferase [Thermosyntropha lipolytica]SHG44787.1 UDP-GlcNAc:undecaprenyl-phosphate GlcNAc-1-phosphate transferase [Thermosyntropha lipolytica DSM 11003]
MYYDIYILVIILAFIISFVAVPLSIKLAFALGAIDNPNPRKVHERTMPRLGGLGIFVAFMLGMLFMPDLAFPFRGIIYGGIIIFIVGLLDDLFKLKAWIKLIGQMAAAAVAVYCGITVNFVTNPFDGMLNLGILSIPVTLLWIIGVTNAINLIDGLDGLAGGVSLIAAGTLGAIALLKGNMPVFYASFLLVGAILGFLPYNFHPARTFMGDGGSNFLGFVLACLAVSGTAKGATAISLFLPIVVLGIPIFDTFFAIVRRVNRGVPIFKPDRDHLHHRLLALGLSHRGCVLVIYGISAVFAGVAVVLSLTSSPKALWVLGAFLVLVIIAAERIGLFRGEVRVEASWRQEEVNRFNG